MAYVAKSLDSIKNSMYQCKSYSSSLWTCKDKKIFFEKRDKGWIFFDHTTSPEGLDTNFRKLGIDPQNMTFATLKELTEFLKGFLFVTEQADLSSVVLCSQKIYRFHNGYGLTLIGNQGNWRPQFSGTPGPLKDFYRQHIDSGKSKWKLLQTLQQKAEEHGQQELFPELFEAKNN